MNTFIVPIDFSETSTNAARFAAHLSSQVRNSNIVLYNVFDTIEPGSDGTPLATDEEDDRCKKSNYGACPEKCTNRIG